MHPQIFRPADFAKEAAHFILRAAHRVLAERGLFRLALSGGNTPRPIYETLAVLARDLPWGRVRITFADERCVPPDHPDSNFRLAKESLLDRVPIPATSVLRIPGEIDPDEAAREYEQQLSGAADQLGETRYVHDLILLGVGGDGHTASLFPGSPALNETARCVVAANGPKPPMRRVTFTLPLINAARQVAFLVNDVDGTKQRVIEEIVSGRSPLPAAKVRPAPGSLTWIVGAAGPA